MGANAWLVFTIHDVVSAHTTNRAISKCGQSIRHVELWLEERIGVPGSGGPRAWTTPWAARSTSHHGGHVPTSWAMLQKTPERVSAHS